jgi:hypothetical protein
MSCTIAIDRDPSKARSKSRLFNVDSRRARACAGDARICLARRVNEVSREVQWQARQDVMRATPPQAGPAERTAREFLPGALV